MPCMLCMLCPASVAGRDSAFHLHMRHGGYPEVFPLATLPPLAAAITGYRMVGVPADGTGNITLPVGMGMQLPSGQVRSTSAADRPGMHLEPCLVLALVSNTSRHPYACTHAHHPWLHMPYPSLTLPPPSPAEPVHLPGGQLSAQHALHILRICSKPCGGGATQRPRLTQGSAQARVHGKAPLECASLQCAEQMRCGCFVLPSMLPAAYSLHAPIPVAAGAQARPPSSALLPAPAPTYWQRLLAPPAMEGQT